YKSGRNVESAGDPRTTRLWVSNIRLPTKAISEGDDGVHSVIRISQMMWPRELLACPADCPDGITNAKTPGARWKGRSIHKARFPDLHFPYDALSASFPIRF